MSAQSHAPQILPMAGVTDEWVVRCDCGCKLYEQYPTKEEAEERADEAQEAGKTAESRVDHTDTLAGGPEPI